MRRYYQKMLFPKFQLIQILRLQFMHDYLDWHCSIIDYCVKQSLVYETFNAKNGSHFISKGFLPNFFGGNVLLRGELQIDAKNSNFDIFESALYMKSGSMVLRSSTIFVKVQLPIWWLISIKQKTKVYGEMR